MSAKGTFHGAAIGLAVALASGAGYAQGIGVVDRLQGAATATLSDVRQLSPAAPLFMEEELATGQAARLQVEIADGTVLTLGANAVLVLDEMVYDPEVAEGSIVLRISSGAFRMVSGGIADLPGRPLKVNTPVGTIGIRGTDFWGLVSANRLDLALLDDGGVYVTNNAGTFELTEPLTVITITSADQPPQALPRKLTDNELTAAVQTVTFED